MKKSDVFIAGIFICLIYSYFCVTNELSNAREISNLQAVEISMLRDSVNMVVDKNGQLTFQIASAEVERKQLKEALELAGYNIKNLREREIEYRRINALLKARLEASGTITSTVRDTFTVVKTDTVRIQKVENSTNGYLSIFDASIQNQQLEFSYRYKADFDFFQTSHKNKTTVSVALNDPNAEITSARSVTVTHKKRFYQKPWVWAVAGFVSGLFITR